MPMNTLSFSSMPPFNTDEIERRIEANRIPLRIIPAATIEEEARAFRQILLNNREWVDYYQGMAADKWLEHFLSVHFLNPQKGDVVLDVASHWSPFFKIVQTAAPIRTMYVQDLCFEQGIHGNRIGSDCTNIPLSDDSVDLIAVNNSIEHFEQDKDSLFLKEAYRLLKPGGKICIVPLFMATEAVNMADPDLDLSGVVFDSDAILVSAKPWKIPFARCYTPETFVQRLLKAVPQFEYEIMSIHGMSSFDPSLNYWQFVACMRKPGNKNAASGFLKKILSKLV